MNLFEFYRVDVWIRNLGITLVAIFTLDFIPNIFYALITLVQILLIQAYSFPMNNYFDYKVRGERNYIGEQLKYGVDEKLVLFLCLLPLLLLLPTLLFLNKFLILLIFYIVFFFLYDFSGFRLKNHYLPSILINSFCLGLIPYAYPYLSLTNEISVKGIIFSLIFFCYMAFHEVVHQIAHMRMDKIKSLPQVVGIKKSVEISKLFLLIPIILSLLAIYLDPVRNSIFIVTILFSTVRIFKLSRIKFNIKTFQGIRNRWDKFYSFHEGVLYIFYSLLFYFL